METKPKPARRTQAAITRESYAHLPAMLTRKEFTDYSGLNDKDLDAMTVTANGLELAELVKIRRGGLIPVFRPRGQGTHGKYYKEDLGKMLGWA